MHQSFRAKNFHLWNFLIYGRHLYNQNNTNIFYMPSLCINMLTRITNTKNSDQDTNSFSFLAFCWQNLYVPKWSEQDRFIRFKQNYSVTKRFKIPLSLLLDSRVPKSLCLKIYDTIQKFLEKLQIALDYSRTLSNRQLCHMRHRPSVCIKTLQLSWFVRVHRIFMLKQFWTA